MKHGWNSLTHYLSIHEKVLRTFWIYMITPCTYGPPTQVTSEWLRLACRNIQLRTLSGAIAHVKIEKDIEIDSSHPRRPQARTWGYSYQAYRPDGSQLIRYCSPDVDASMIGAYRGTAHHGYHHIHDFTSGSEVVQQVQNDEWPHVGEFLTEIRQRF